MPVIQHKNMPSPFATPKKPATDALLHPPGSVAGIARAAANGAQGKDGIEDVQAATAATGCCISNPLLRSIWRELTGSVTIE